MKHSGTHGAFLEKSVTEFLAAGDHCRRARDASSAKAGSNGTSPAFSNAARPWLWIQSLMSDMLAHLSPVGRGGASSERREQASPVAFGVADVAHPIATYSVPVKFPMLKLNARRIVTLSDEAHFDFRF